MNPPFGPLENHQLDGFWVIPLHLSHQPVLGRFGQSGLRPAASFASLGLLRLAAQEAPGAGERDAAPQQELAQGQQLEKEGGLPIKPAQRASVDLASFGSGCER